MIGDICAEIKNYFVYENDRHIGDWVIENGEISPILELPTQYIRIQGSRLNNGVHMVDNMHLKDEAFHGAICIMSPPLSFLSLCDEIAQWQDQYGAIDSPNMSPFSSESLGAYSYSRGSLSGAASASGQSVPTWKNVFASRLAPYRRIREL